MARVVGEGGGGGGVGVIILPALLLQPHVRQHQRGVLRSRPTTPSRHNGSVRGRQGQPPHRPVGEARDFHDAHGRQCVGTLRGSSGRPQPPQAGQQRCREGRVGGHQGQSIRGGRQVGRDRGRGAGVAAASRQPPDEAPNVVVAAAFSRKRRPGRLQGRGEGGRHVRPSRLGGGAAGRGGGGGVSADRWRRGRYHTRRRGARAAIAFVVRVVTRVIVHIEGRPHRVKGGNAALRGARRLCVRVRASTTRARRRGPGRLAARQRPRRRMRRWQHGVERGERVPRGRGARRPAAAARAVRTGRRGAPAPAAAAAARAGVARAASRPAAGGGGGAGGRGVRVGAWTRGRRRRRGGRRFIAGAAASSPCF